METPTVSVSARVLLTVSITNSVCARVSSPADFASWILAHLDYSATLCSQVAEVLTGSCSAFRTGVSEMREQLRPNTNGMCTMAIWAMKTLRVSVSLWVLLTLKQCLCTSVFACWLRIINIDTSRLFRITVQPGNHQVVEVAGSCSAFSTGISEMREQLPLNKNLWHRQQWRMREQLRPTQMVCPLWRYGQWKPREFLCQRKFCSLWKFSTLFVPEQFLLLIQRHEYWHVNIDSAMTTRSSIHIIPQHRTKGSWCNRVVEELTGSCVLLQ